MNGIYPSISHEVLDGNATIVAVAVNAETTVSGSLTFSEWVRDHAVAGLKANLGLEGVLSDRTYHL